MSFCAIFSCLSGMYNSILAYQMKPDASRLKQLIREFEESRLAYVQDILQEQGPLRSGSLVTIRRKCGKPNCRCATGEGHSATYLSTKQSGKTRMVYLSAICLKTVAQQARSYRRFSKNRATLVKLARQSLQHIDRLQEMLQTTTSIVNKKKRTARYKPQKAERKGLIWIWLYSKKTKPWSCKH